MHCSVVMKSVLSCVTGCDPSKTIPGDGKDNDCDAVVDEEVRNFEDDDKDGLIDEDLSSDPIEIRPPPSTSLLSCRNLTNPQQTGLAAMTFVSDACRPFSIDYIDNVTNGKCHSAIRRLWIGRDACGNIARATQVINIDDRQPPVLFVPSDTTATCSELDSLAVSVAIDDCAANHSITTWFEEEVSGCVVSRQWRAKDLCNNVAVGGTQKIVLQLDPLRLEVPGNAQLACTDPIDPSTTGRPSVKQPGLCKWNQSIVAEVVHEDTVTVDETTCDRSISRLWTASDVCGRTVQGIQSIIVKHTAPVLTAPDNVTARCKDVPHLSIVGQASVGQSCTEVTINHRDQLTGPTVHRVWSAVDKCGAEATSVVQTIHLRSSAPACWIPHDVSIPCHESYHPNATGWAAITKDIDDDCFNLGITSSTLGYVDVMDSAGCPGFIVRNWRISSSLGHNIMMDQQISFGKTGSI